MKVLVVFGTRPEAIKMCPLILEMRKHQEINCVVCLTEQHREMLHQVMEVFEVKEKYNLNIMRKQQTLNTITVDILEKMQAVLEAEHPDIVLVHGDTSTSFTAALAAFYQRIPVGHIEAGLRTGNIYSPFPEEMNRQLTDVISTYRFAPTQTNRRNLEREGITENVFVTGNTVIDSFAYTVQDNYIFHDKCLNTFFDTFGEKGIPNRIERKIVLVTAHRRENWGEPLENICRAIKRLAEEYVSVIFIYPVHLNPRIGETVYRNLDGIGNVFLIKPIDVLDMHNLFPYCYMIMTDSGGIQEEAPSFGKPVLILRAETERAEAVEAGVAKEVGTSEERIYYEAKRLLDDPHYYKQMSQAVNPYGDGHACERIVGLLLHNRRNLQADI